MKKLKLSKKSNKQLMESALKQIEEETGFHILNKNLGNCYFIFETKEKNTICHFRIKEIPGFIFALWHTSRVKMPYTDPVYIPEGYELIFFTQYERDLDKFKPSRSGFVTGLQRQVYLEGEDEHKVEEWNMWKLTKILKFMKSHRQHAIYYSNTQSLDIYEQVSWWEAFKYNLRTAYQHYKYESKKWIEFTTMKLRTFIFIKQLHEMNVLVCDYGDSWFPRIHIDIRRKKDASILRYAEDLLTIDNFIDKYQHKVSIQVWEHDITQKLSDQELQDDKQFNIRFKNKVKREVKDKDSRVLYIDVDFKV